MSGFPTIHPDEFKPSGGGLTPIAPEPQPTPQVSGDAGDE